MSCDVPCPVCEAMKRNPPNARFWIFHSCGNGESGWVKLTLTPGQSIVFMTGGPNEEGYSYHHMGLRYDVDDMVIVREDVTQGRDCDGPLSTYTETQCPIPELPMAIDRDQFVPIDPSDPSVRVPRYRVPWTKVNAWQRDVYAEQAGY